MKLEFFSNNNKFNFELGKSNHFLFSIGGGKSVFCNLLHDGFSSKGDNGFVVNGVNVDKSMFNVLYIDEIFDFDEYLKFKVRGEMFKTFKVDVLDDCEDLLNKYLVEINNVLTEKKFENYFNTLNDSLSCNKIFLKVGLNSIDDIYDKVFKVGFDVEALSYSSKIEVVIKHMILFREVQKTTVLIIDDFSLRLGKEKLKSILDTINNEENIHVIFVSSMVSVHDKYDKYYIGSTKINFDNLYTNMYLYSQWDKKGDFNSFHDSNIHLIQDEDLVRSKEFLLKYENLISEINDSDQLYNLIFSFLNEFKL